MKISEMFKDALPIITNFAPTIASAIGGPYGVAAGYVIPILATAFGSHPSDIPGLVSKILGDSEAQKKLAGLEEEHGDWIDSLMDSINNLSKAEVSIKLEWQEQKS